MDYSKIQAQADKLHRSAKDGKATINGTNYSFTFDHYQGTYTVTDILTGDFITNFNTRKLPVAKQWMKEWLNN